MRRSQALDLLVPAHGRGQERLEGGRGHGLLQIRSTRGPERAGAAQAAAAAACSALVAVGLEGGGERGVLAAAAASEAAAGCRRVERVESRGRRRSAAAAVCAAAALPRPKHVLEGGADGVAALPVAIALRRRLLRLRPGVQALLVPELARCLDGLAQRPCSGLAVEDVCDERVLGRVHDVGALLGVLPDAEEGEEADPAVHGSGAVGERQGDGGRGYSDIDLESVNFAFRKAPLNSVVISRTRTTKKGETKRELHVVLQPFLSV